MKLNSFQAIAAALNEAGVRYLVAGGMAVNVHGYLRFTKDVDIVTQLRPENIRATFSALATLGYRPLVPITAQQFGDDDLRATMIREKGMQVLQFVSDQHRETPIDVFASEPFPFDAEYTGAIVRPLANVGPVRFVTIQTLIAMKTAADRPQDRLDVEQLQIRIETDDQAS